MASLHIILDPDDRVSPESEFQRRVGIKSARLSIPDSLEGIDVYNLARKLAELLLEQL